METFKRFWLAMPVPDRKVFAARCDTTANYLNMVAHGQKPRIGESLAINIERESNGVVRCEQMRPDVDWAYLRSTQPLHENTSPRLWPRPLRTCSQGAASGASQTSARASSGDRSEIAASIGGGVETMVIKGKEVA